MTAKNDCCATLPVTGDVCGKRAPLQVTFKDGQKATLCQTCVMRLEQTAPGSIVKTEKIP